MNLFIFLLGLLTIWAMPIDGSPIAGHDMISLNLTMALNTANSTAVSGYDPSFEYHDYSTVQVWMGKDKRTVGTVVGARLYQEVWHLLDKGCPWNTKHNTCHDVQPGLLTFTGRCLWRFPADIKDCTTELYDVYAKWENEKIRRLLIGAVAGALEAVTNERALDPTNCYALAEQKACNVGDVVRVNFPNSNTGVRNYMHIRIYNWYTGFGTWQCCSGNHLKNMDKSIDGLGKEIVEQFPQWWTRPFTRDNRCIINGWKAC